MLTPPNARRSYSHLTDYLRYLFLYKFGGTCTFHPTPHTCTRTLTFRALADLDMDAPWVRSPPNSNLEFIGADYSTLASDLDWTLDEDGMYLAPGVMRFRKGWTLFKDIMEQAFSATYRADCFNCVGPRAITLGVRPRRRQLELAGFTIVPSNVLYPKNWITSHELVKTLPAGQALVELEKIVETSWSIHLFGKMTNHLRIQRGSIVGEAFDYFSLGIPRRVGYLSTSDRELGKPLLGQGLELRAPSTYRYRSRLSLIEEEVKHLELRGSVDGRFDGLDLIFMRGAQAPRVDRAEVRVTTQRGGKVTWSSSSARLAGRSMEGEGEVAGATGLVVVLEGASVRDVNAVLGSLRLLPGGVGWKGDTMDIRVSFGEESAQAVVVVDA